MEFHLEDPLTDFHDLPCSPSDLSSSLFLIESDHMLSDKYTRNLHFDVANIRQEVVSLISQICFKFDKLVSYLAVNYMDRFLSTQKLTQTKPWVLRIMAVSCVSLSAKMQGMSFCLSDIQVANNGGLIFDQHTIQRMEVVILGALKWRMRSVTPFSFVPFFISLFQLKDPPLTQALRARALELIFNAQNDINLLGFKPSTVAASALISASQELFPLRSSDLSNAIFNCSSVNKENVKQCWEAMQKQMEEEIDDDTVSWRSDTPINVLDQWFSSSSMTSDSERTDGATQRAAKRRRRNF